jgi:two-component system sensor histidine kinase MprB
VTLRARLALVAAGVVAVVLAAASLTVYFVMKHEIYAQIDSDMTSQLQSQIDHPHVVTPGFGYNVYSAYYEPGGTQVFGPNMRMNDAIRRAANGRTNRAVYQTLRVQDHQVREVVAPTEAGGAVVVLRVIDDVAHDLERLRIILLLVSLGGVAAAALAGFLISRTTLAPVLRLTAAAERIARTRDPSERVSEGGGGELQRLGGAFNTMLGALEESLETQRRFVADASHELRTPLTSMQTNIEVLKQSERLEPSQRAQLFADLERESHEMRNLIADLLELARGDGSQERRPVQLDELVESALERARTRFPTVEWAEQLEPTRLDGVPERLERAVWNLLENAAKWNNGGGPVEVTLRGGDLVVRDHGPGIAPEDRERVFDRFYRSTAARSLPGSGLGLAIVREVAEAHGGHVAAEEPEGGGAQLRLSLPKS